VHSNRSRKW